VGPRLITYVCARGWSPPLTAVLADDSYRVMVAVGVRVVVLLRATSRNLTSTKEEREGIGRSPRNLA